jgi:hypothetical protein
MRWPENKMKSKRSWRKNGHGRRHTLNKTNTEVYWIMEYKAMYLKQLKEVTSAHRPEGMSSSTNEKIERGRIRPSRKRVTTLEMLLTLLVKLAAIEASASDRERPTWDKKWRLEEV